MKVLVVSRSDRQRAAVRASLDPAWEISEASEGNEAIRFARARPLDLVIADESSEPYGAFGLARDLKILRTPPAVVVLLQRAQDAWLARWSGADRWLVGPLDPFALGRAARELAATAPSDA